MARRRCPTCARHFFRKKRKQLFCSKSCARTRELGGCRVAGCQRNHTARGLCRFHYQRKAAGVDMTAPKRVVMRRGQARACWAPGCAMPAKTYRLCGAHFRMAKKAMAPLCRVGGCGRRSEGNGDGLCHTHSRRRAAGADMSAPIGPFVRGRKCSVSGCERRHKAKGLCDIHYAKALNWAGSRPGKCRNCTSAAVSGSVFCAKHKALLRARKRDLIHARRFRGECARCGTPSGGAFNCGGCKKHFRQYTRTRRETIDRGYVRRLLVVDEIGRAHV